MSNVKDAEKFLADIAREVNYMGLRRRIEERAKKDGAELVLYGRGLGGSLGGFKPRGRGGMRARQGFRTKAGKGFQNPTTKGRGARHSVWLDGKKFRWSPSKNTYMRWIPIGGGKVVGESYEEALQRKNKRESAARVFKPGSEPQKPARRYTTRKGYVSDARGIEDLMTRRGFLNAWTRVVKKASEAIQSGDEGADEKAFDVLSRGADFLVERYLDEYNENGFDALKNLGFNVSGVKNPENVSENDVRGFIEAAVNKELVKLMGNSGEDLEKNGALFAEKLAAFDKGLKKYGYDPAEDDDEEEYKGYYDEQEAKENAPKGEEDAPKGEEDASEDEEDATSAEEDAAQKIAAEKKKESDDAALQEAFIKAAQATGQDKKKLPKTTPGAVNVDVGERSDDEIDEDANEEYAPDDGEINEDAFDGDAPSDAGAPSDGENAASDVGDDADGGEKPSEGTSGEGGGGLSPEQEKRWRDALAAGNRAKEKADRRKAENKELQDFLARQKDYLGVGLRGIGLEDDKDIEMALRKYAQQKNYRIPVDVETLRKNKDLSDAVHHDPFDYQRAMIDLFQEHIGKRKEADKVYESAKKAIQESDEDDSLKEAKLRALDAAHNEVLEECRKAVHAGADWVKAFGDLDLNEHRSRPNGGLHGPGAYYQLKRKVAEFEKEWGNGGEASAHAVGNAVQDLQIEPMRDATSIDDVIDVDFEAKPETQEIADERKPPLLQATEPREVAGAASEPKALTDERNKPLALGRELPADAEKSANEGTGTPALTDEREPLLLGYEPSPDAENAAQSVAQEASEAEDSVKKKPAKEAPGPSDGSSPYKSRYGLWQIDKRIHKAAKEIANARLTNGGWNLRSYPVSQRYMNSCADTLRWDVEKLSEQTSRRGRMELKRLCDETEREYAAYINKHNAIVASGEEPQEDAYDAMSERTDDVRRKFAEIAEKFPLKKDGYYALDEELITSANRENATRRDTYTVNNDSYRKSVDDARLAAEAACDNATEEQETEITKALDRYESELAAVCDDMNETLATHSGASVLTPEQRVKLSELSDKESELREAFTNKLNLIMEGQPPIAWPDSFKEGESSNDAAEHATHNAGSEKQSTRALGDAPSVAQQPALETPGPVGTSEESSAEVGDAVAQEDPAVEEPAAKEPAVDESEEEETPVDEETEEEIGDTIVDESNPDDEGAALEVADAQSEEKNVAPTTEKSTDTSAQRDLGSPQRDENGYFPVDERVQNGQNGEYKSYKENCDEVRRVVSGVVDKLGEEYRDAVQAFGDDLERKFAEIYDRHFTSPDSTHRDNIYRAVEAIKEVRRERRLLEAIYNPVTDEEVESAWGGQANIFEWDDANSFNQKAHRLYEQITERVNETPPASTPGNESAVEVGNAPENEVEEARPAQEEPVASESAQEEPVAASQEEEDAPVEPKASEEERVEESPAEPVEELDEESAPKPDAAREPSALAVGENAEETQDEAEPAAQEIPDADFSSENGEVGEAEIGTAESTVGAKAAEVPSHAKTRKGTLKVDSKALKEAKKICDSLADLGFNPKPWSQDSQDKIEERARSFNDSLKKEGGLTDEQQARADAALKRFAYDVAKLGDEFNSAIAFGYRDGKFDDAILGIVDRITGERKDRFQRYVQEITELAKEAKNAPEPSDSDASKSALAVDEEAPANATEARDEDAEQDRTFSTDDIKRSYAPYYLAKLGFDLKRDAKWRDRVNHVRDDLKRANAYFKRHGTLEGFEPKYEETKDDHRFKNPSKLGKPFPKETLAELRKEAKSVEASHKRTEELINEIKKDPLRIPDSQIRFIHEPISEEKIKKGLKRLRETYADVAEDEPEPTDDASKEALDAGPLAESPEGASAVVGEGAQEEPATDEEPTTEETAQELGEEVTPTSEEPAAPEEAATQTVGKETAVKSKRGGKAKPKDADADLNATYERVKELQSDEIAEAASDVAAQYKINALRDFVRRFGIKPRGVSKEAILQNFATDLKANSVDAVKDGAAEAVKEDVALTKATEPAAREASAQEIPETEFSDEVVEEVEERNDGGGEALKEDSGTAQEVASAAENEREPAPVEQPSRPTPKKPVKPRLAPKKKGLDVALDDIDKNTRWETSKKHGLGGLSPIEMFDRDASKSFGSDRDQGGEEETPDRRGAALARRIIASMSFDPDAKPDGNGRYARRNLSDEEKVAELQKHVDKIDELLKKGGSEENKKSFYVAANILRRKIVRLGGTPSEPLEPPVEEKAKTAPSKKKSKSTPKRQRQSAPAASDNVVEPPETAPAPSNPQPKKNDVTDWAPKDISPKDAELIESAKKAAEHRQRRAEERRKKNEEKSKSQEESSPYEKFVGLKDRVNSARSLIRRASEGRGGEDSKAKLVELAKEVGYNYGAEGVKAFAQELGLENPGDSKKEILRNLKTLLEPKEDAAATAAGAPLTQAPSNDVGASSFKTPKRQLSDKDRENLASNAKNMRVAYRGKLKKGSPQEINDWLKPLVDFFDGFEGGLDILAAGLKGVDPDIRERLTALANAEPKKKDVASEEPQVEERVHPEIEKSVKEAIALRDASDLALTGENINKIMAIADDVARKHKKAGLVAFTKQLGLDCQKSQTLRSLREDLETYLKGMSLDRERVRIIREEA